MKYVKYAIMFLLLLGICVIAPAATRDIGAVQLEGSATDIGAVQEPVAAEASIVPIIIQVRRRRG